MSLSQALNQFAQNLGRYLALPKDVQTAFAIRMLFTHRPVDRYGASMFLHYQRGFNVKFEGIGANQY